jgi:sugar O-acyltransferase (sialic acid O-acetyltransferase NeuD family)
MTSSKSPRPCVIWGVTGQGRVVLDILGTEGVEVLCCFDNDPTQKSLSREIPIAFGEDGLRSFVDSLPRLGFSVDQVDSVAAIGGGRGHERRQVSALMLSFGLSSRQVVHRTSVISRTADLGLACQVMAAVNIGPGARIGQHVIINSGANVDHDCVIGDCSHLGPNAALAGEVTVGENVFIGTNATVLPRINIGSGSTVGAGAVVTRDIPPNSVAIGVPARVRGTR